MAGFGRRPPASPEKEVSGHMHSLKISEVKDTFLECPVCTEHFDQSDRRPRLLHSCLHAFCTQCLQQLLDKEGKRQITCPLCRHVEHVKGKSDSLPVDPVRDKLTEYIQIKEQKAILCTDCPDGNDAKSRCRQCLCYLCEHCTSAHRRNRLSRDHVILSLDQLLEDPDENFKRIHFCPSHPTQQLEFYCETDENLCCVSCCIVDHKGHEIQKVADAAAKRVNNVDRSMITSQQTAACIKGALREMELEKDKILEIKTKSVRDINTVFDTLKEAIDVHRAKLLSQVEAESNMALSVVRNTTAVQEQTLIQIESTETYFRRSKEKADVVEMLQMYPSIMKSIESAKEVPDVQQNTNQRDKFMFISSQPDTGNILKQFGELTEAKVKLGKQRALEVRGISEDISDETLDMYFEGRRAGGGEVKNLERSSSDTAFIFFVDDEVLARVACRRHLLRRHELEVAITYR